jgi:hypothetical protein
MKTLLLLAGLFALATLVLALLAYLKKSRNSGRCEWGQLRTPRNLAHSGASFRAISAHPWSKVKVRACATGS